MCITPASRSICTGSVGRGCCWTFECITSYRSSCHASLICFHAHTNLVVLPSQVAAAEQAELRAHMDEEIAWAQDQALGVPGLQSECRAAALFTTPHDSPTFHRLQTNRPCLCAWRRGVPH